jgi:hypothetical protein
VNRLICPVGLAQRFEVTEAQSTYDLNRLGPPVPHPTTGIMTKRTVKSQSMNNPKSGGVLLALTAGKPSQLLVSAFRIRASVVINARGVQHASMICLNFGNRHMTILEY